MQGLAWRDPALLEGLVALVKEASAVVMAVYATDFAVRGKDDASPVTEADEKAEAVILRGRSTAPRSSSAATASSRSTSP